MKKILLVCMAMVALSIVIASCSKDNDELIVGKWQITSLEGGAVSWHTITDGSTNNSSYETVYEDDWGWVFNADGTGYSYEIRDGQEHEMGQFTYTIDEETLHMPYVDFHIEKLNSRKLRLRDRVEMTDVDGNFLRYEYGYLNFKKQ
jgi:hypothetical protein